MHIPDGFLSPAVAGSTLAGSGVVWGWSLRTLRDLPTEAVPRLGLAGALLSTVEVVAFPIPGGTSVHLSGVPLVALWLGSPAALFLSGVALGLQALFGHGGILTWGANFLNMGILGAWLPVALVRLRPGRAAVFAGTVGALLAGAALAAVELGLSGTLPLRHTLGVMVLATAPAAVLEGFLTAVAYRFVRPVAS